MRIRILFLLLLISFSTFVFAEQLVVATTNEEFTYDLGMIDNISFNPLEIIINYNDVENPILISDIMYMSFMENTSNDDSAIPITKILQKIYPNPFNPQTTISFNLDTNATVKLEVYNAKGQLVKELLSKDMNPGSHQVMWNGKDRNGKNQNSGVYFSKLSIDGRTIADKMILLK